MVQTAKVDNDRSPSAAQPASGDAPLAQSYFAPPPSQIHIATATPDFLPDFRIICRGDEYGRETSLAFRQITENNAPYEQFRGVAVELESLSGDASRGAVTERARIDLTLAGTTISAQVPPFISVPTPEKTILFITPKDPSTAPATLMREIKRLFAELNSEIDHSHPDVLKMIQPKESPKALSPENFAQSHSFNGITLGVIYDQSGQMISALKATNAFPKWREFNWTHLQMSAVEALRPMITGANPADCVAPYSASLKQYYRNPGLDNNQRDTLVAEFVRVASELCRGPKLKVAGSATA